MVVAIVGYYATVQYVWLNYGVFSKWWVPYHFVPISA